MALNLLVLNFVLICTLHIYGTYTDNDVNMLLALKLMCVFLVRGQQLIS